MSHVWRAAQTGLRSQLAPHVYDNWIKPIQGVETEGGIRLLVPSYFHAQWVQDNYSHLIRQALQMEFQFEVQALSEPNPLAPLIPPPPSRQLRVIAGGQASQTAKILPPQDLLPVESVSSPAAYAPPAPHSPEPTPVRIATAFAPPQETSPVERTPEKLPSEVVPPPIRPTEVAPPSDLSRDAFNTPAPFIEWPGCQMASRGLMMFLEARDQLPFNPFFLHAAPGMGKTALVRHHIQKIQSQHPELKVAYLSVPHFVQDLVRHIERRQVQLLQERYQKYDILVIDEAQHLEKKKKTQSELLHLMNFFIVHRRPVVVLSQKLPHELDLDEGLRQRLQEGLRMEITGLDPTYQGQIFRKLLRHARLSCPEPLSDAVERSSLHAVSDVIALWTRLNVHHSFTQAWPTQEDWGQWIRPHQKDFHRSSISPKLILGRICETFHVTEEDLKGPSRKKTVADARRVLVLFLRTLAEMSYQEIGELLDRHHSTILHTLESTTQRRKEDPIFERQIEFLSSAFKS